MAYDFGFIGCGHMGSTLCQVVLSAGYRVGVCDHHPERLSALKKAGAVLTDEKDVSENSSFLVLGVKPQVLFDALSSALPNVKKDAVIVSMAAGVSLSALEKAADGRAVIRIMPNTPCEVGAGTVLYATSENVQKDAETAFIKAFSPAGSVIKTEDGKMDAFSALTGCGPAFCYLFLDALAKGTEKCGLKYEEALPLAADLLVGAGKMAKKYGDVVSLKNAVATPNGTTIEGIMEMEKDGLCGAVENGVQASYRRTLELKK